MKNNMKKKQQMHTSFSGSISKTITENSKETKILRKSIYIAKYELSLCAFL